MNEKVQRNEEDEEMHAFICISSKQLNRYTLRTQKYGTAGSKIACKTV